MFTACDVIIRGSGMAGASLAAKLAPHRKVVLEEIEDQPGRHATGRSAAMFFESYSNHHARLGACQPGLSRTPTGRVCCRAITLAAQRALRLRRPASGGVARQARRTRCSGHAACLVGRSGDGLVPDPAARQWSATTPPPKPSSGRQGKAAVASRWPLRWHALR